MSYVNSSDNRYSTIFTNFWLASDSCNGSDSGSAARSGVGSDSRLGTRARTAK